RSFQLGHSNSGDMRAQEVGIGTITPGATLDVLGPHVSGIGRAQLKGTSNVGLLALDTTTTGGASGIVFKTAGVKKADLEFDDSLSNLSVYNELFSASNPVATFASSGNVGVGTTTPQTTLDVNGTARLATYASAPFTCDVAHDGALALTTGHFL